MTAALASNPRGRTPSPSLARTHALEHRLTRLADGGPAAIEDRLQQLDREWSAGRAAKVTLGVTIVLGFALAALVGPAWLALPAAGAVFLLQHLFTRSSWLVRVLEEAGLRAGSEIEQEKFALKALRGDFKHVPTVHDIEDRDDITRLEGEGGIVLEPDDAKVDSKVAVRKVIQAARH